MKRFLSLLASVLLLFSLVPADVSAGTDTPVIALTASPAFGGVTPFEGVVFREDGGTFDPAAYRVSMYLEQPQWGNFWLKPSEAQPCVPLDEQGRFTLPYDSTIQSDREGTVFHLLLLPSSYTPAAGHAAADFNRTRSASLDHVTVTRAEGEENVIDPLRPAPYIEPPAPAIPSGLLPVKTDKIAVDVSFYTDGRSPGAPLSEAQIRGHLTALSAFSDTVRFYKAGGELSPAYTIAHEMGFTVLGNAWLARETDEAARAANLAELDALIAHCNSGLVRVAIVGSEVLKRGDLTEEKLVEYINYVRERITDETIPVTTAEDYDHLLASRRVRNACNLLMPNSYPCLGGASVDQAAGYFIAKMQTLTGDGKEILVSETGWPTQGTMTGAAVAGEAQAAQYYAAIRDWSLSSNTQVLYFEYADEPWKARDEGEIGEHWGFFTTEGTLKSGYSNLSPFRTPEGWTVRTASRTDTAATVSLTNRTGGTGRVWFAVCAYRTDGQMISCNLDSLSLGALESGSLTIPLSADGAVLRAIVLDGETFAPLLTAVVV